MTDFTCNECGCHIEKFHKEFNYCPKCGILAPHWQKSFSGLLGLSNIDKELQPAIKLFRKNEYLNSARTATILLESKLKEIGNTDMYGTRLVKYILEYEYDKKNKIITKDPIVAINNLSTDVERNEQDGFKALLLGIFQGIRNVIMHDQVPLDPMHCLATLITCNIAFDVLKNGSLKNERFCIWQKVKKTTNE